MRSPQLATAYDSPLLFSGFFYSNPQLGVAYNVLYCDVHVREVVYQYHHSGQTGPNEMSTPTFRTISFRSTDLQTTKLIATMIDSQQAIAAVVARSLGAAVEAGTNYEDNFGIVLSETLLGASASIFESAPATSLVQLRTILVSKLSLIPLFGLIIASVLLWYAQSYLE